MAGFTYWLRPRNWSFRVLLASVTACAAIATSPYWWRGNPIARWNAQVAEYTAVVALVLCILFPLHWVGDRIWAAVEARENRLRRER